MISAAMRNDATREQARFSQTPSTPKVLAISDLRKVYGDTVAVDGVSFHVDRNEIVGLLGPNGAGKTTIINMILGVLEPSAGTIHIEGLDIARHRSQALAKTNFTAVYAPVPGNLTVCQNLRFFGLLYGVSNLSARMDEVIRQFDIERFRNTKCGVLSSGEQTRASLAKAMLNQPHLLLLDEPTSSLDPSAARDIRPGSASSRPRRPSACCGPRTICTRSSRCATACCSSRTAGSCSKATPRPCPASTARRRSKTCSLRWLASR